MSSAKRYVPKGHTKTENRVLVDRELGAKSFELIHGIVRPGGGTAFHRHRVESAIFFLRGRAKVDIGPRSSIVDAGTLAFIPAGVNHRITCLGNRTMEVLLFYAPPRARAKSSP